MTEHQETSLKYLAISMRPAQWTKNAIVLAAFFFAFWDPAQTFELIPGLLKVVPAVLIFCLTSSGIYVLNDILDIKADQAHPIKRHRPIAAGQVSVVHAWWLCVILIVIGIAGAYFLSVSFALIILSYVVLQLIYSSWLKRIALVDIFVIAAGFVLRAIAGAVVLSVDISSWLLLCTFLLALFLALCKRRQEKYAVSDSSSEQRPTLDGYDAKLLDQLIAIVSAATIVSYSIYTLAPDTQEKFGTSALGFTIPFVLFGIFRYLDLVYRHKKGDRPERILLTDIPTLVNIALYVAAVVLIFTFRQQ